jgi:hypothetical protein
MEYVYDCSEPPKPSLADRVIGFALGALTVFLSVVGVLGFIGIRLIQINH